MISGRSIYWILDGRQPVPATSFLEWAQWMESADAVGRRKVASTKISKRVSVETDFRGVGFRTLGLVDPRESLALDPCSYSCSRHLQLFETIVFGGLLHGEMLHSSTWAEADACHSYMVRWVRVRRIDPRAWSYALRNAQHSAKEFFQKLWAGLCAGHPMPSRRLSGEGENSSGPRHVPGRSACEQKDGAK